MDSTKPLRVQLFHADVIPRSYTLTKSTLSLKSAGSADEQLRDTQTRVIVEEAALPLEKQVPLYHSVATLMTSQTGLMLPPLSSSSPPNSPTSKPLSRQGHMSQASQSRLSLYKLLSMSHGGTAARVSADPSDPFNLRRITQRTRSRERSNEDKNRGKTTPRLDERRRTNSRASRGQSRGRGGEIKGLQVRSSSILIGDRPTTQQHTATPQVSRRPNTQQVRTRDELQLQTRGYTHLDLNARGYTDLSGYSQLTNTPMTPAQMGTHDINVREKINEFRRRTDAEFNRRSQERSLDNRSNLHRENSKLTGSSQRNAGESQRLPPVARLSYRHGNQATPLDTQARSQAIELKKAENLAAIKRQTGLNGVAATLEKPKQTNNAQTSGEAESRVADPDVVERPVSAETWHTWRNVNDSYAYNDVKQYIRENELMGEVKEQWIKNWVRDVDRELITLIPEETSSQVAAPVKQQQ